MSYRIEYDFKVVYKQMVAGQVRYAISVLGGDNNVYTDRADSRGCRYQVRARSWDLQFLGTAEQVIADACLYAGEAAGGSLQPRGKYMTPEGYVRLIARVLDQPVQGVLAPKIRITKKHEAVWRAIVEQGRAVDADGREYGEDVFVSSFNRDDEADLAAYFAIWDRGMAADSTFPPWRFGTAYNLPPPYQGGY